MWIIRIANHLASLLYGGWVFSWMWEWFFVPPFGLPALTAQQGAGIAIVLGAVTTKISPADLAALDIEKTKLEAKIAGALFPWIIWTISGAAAWLWHAIAL